VSDLRITVDGSERQVAAGTTAAEVFEGDRQVGELTGRAPETVSAMRRDGTGWIVEVDVVESHRIPDSTDRMAVYEATLDDQGEVVGMRRLRSYVRTWLGDHGRT